VDPDSQDRRVADVVTALREAPQYPVDEALATAPPEPGIYAWWASPDALPREIPVELHQETGLALLYVGTSPDSAGSQGDLSKRIRVHSKRAIGSSTLRRGLAALLYQDFGWRPIWASTRPALESVDLAALAAWQAEHMAVRWCVVQEPWAIEQAVIAAMRPPMNLEHNAAHPFHATMSARRRTFAQAARRQRDEA
jgi:hypothetical protein